MSQSPARHLNLAGASNFRDLGGYFGQDGRTVRWRKIFRSNHLGHLTAADIAVLRQLGVKNAFDFRGKDERVEALETEARVREAMKDLPGEQIELLRLAFYEGLSHREIADKLDVPLGTVKSRIRLAFGQMKARLSDE